jgi:hypothetical protein
LDILGVIPHGNNAYSEYSQFLIDTQLAAEPAMKADVFSLSLSIMLATMIMMGVALIALVYFKRRSGKP